MWKKRETHLVDIYKTTLPKDECKANKSQPPVLLNSDKRKMVNSSTRIYQGKDFDVFGKEQLEEQSPLYSLEQDTLPRTEFKRGQIEVLSNIIKKRRTEATADGVFITTMLAANAPIASIFVSKSDDNNNDNDDLAYY